MKIHENPYKKCMRNPWRKSIQEMHEKSMRKSMRNP
jgi:hypothetical protein